MKTNAAGLELIKRFEQCRLEAYRPLPTDRWTIGWGHTGDVKEGDRVTQHQADVIFESDVERAELEVSRLCPNANSNQFAALVSLQFNTGKLAHFPHLLARFHAGDYPGASTEFLDIDRSGGVEVHGLVIRRAAESSLFLEPI